MTKDYLEHVDCLVILLNDTISHQMMFVSVVQQRYS